MSVCPFVNSYNNNNYTMNNIKVRNKKSTRTVQKCVFETERQINRQEPHPPIHTYFHKINKVKEGNAFLLFLAIVVDFTLGITNEVDFL